jgi:hypothetical protein
MSENLIVHCCHHKTGTVVVQNILKDLCNIFGLNFQNCFQQNLHKNTDIWVDQHSIVELDKIDRSLIGTHMVRNPCAVIVSAYEYHKKTREKWAKLKIKKIGNITYQEHINSLSQKEGILFEMKNELYLESSRNVIMKMYNWNYKTPNFIELKYEQLMSDFNRTLSIMFRHYGFDEDMVERALKMAEKHNIRNKNEKYLKSKIHITNPKIELDKWKEYFDEEIKQEFNKTYPRDVFEKIGYERCFD